MAMPRPSGKALKIALEVIPGLSAQQFNKKPRKKRRGELSEVEIMQTAQIESFKEVR